MMRATLFIIGMSCLRTVILAIPAWLLWTVMGIGARYFPILPTVWQAPTVTDVVGLFLLLLIGRSAVSQIHISVKA